MASAVKTYLTRLWAALRGHDAEFNDVRRFQEKFGQLSYYDPGFLTRRKLEERARFLQEELDELLAAPTLSLQADALIDLVYVAKGTAVMMGLPWAALWDDVQGANMRKVRGQTARGNLVDVCKPPGWIGPNTGYILAAADEPFGVADFYDTQSWQGWPDSCCRDDEANRHKSCESHGVFPSHPYPNEADL